MNAPFDTLALAKALKTTPLGEDGANAVARAIADIAMADVATKRDLDELGNRLERRMDAIEHKADELASRLTIRIGGTVAAVAGLLFAALKVFP